MIDDGCYEKLTNTKRQMVFLKNREICESSILYKIYLLCIQIYFHSIFPNGCNIFIYSIIKLNNNSFLSPKSINSLFLFSPAAMPCRQFFLNLSSRRWAFRYPIRSFSPSKRTHKDKRELPFTLVLAQKSSANHEHSRGII